MRLAEGFTLQPKCEQPAGGRGEGVAGAGSEKRRDSEAFMGNVRSACGARAA